MGPREGNWAVYERVWYIQDQPEIELVCVLEDNDKNQKDKKFYFFAATAASASPGKC